MANLRTNNLCGEGGRNAYDGSVYFGSQYTFLQLDGSSDFAFGTSDFTIEAWIKIDDDTNTNTIYDSRPSGSNGAQIVLFYSGSGNAILFTHGGTTRITGTVDVGADHAWHHIALTRSSGSTKLFVDGVQDGSTYSDSTSYENPANRPFIGQSGGSTNLDATTFFKGYISNLRVCAGHAVYTANFTPPTSPLTVHYNSDGDETVLLCCQNSDDPTQEATGKTIVANGLTSLVNRTDNLIKNGRFTASATENWTLSGGTAALSTGQSGTFGDGNHVLLTATSSFAYLKQSFTTVVGRTYRVNAQSNGGDASFISTSTSENDAVVTDIRSSTQTTDGRSSSKSFVATQTTYHVILRGNTGGANFDSVSVYEEENRVPPKVIPPYGVDAGNTFGGGISMNSLDYMYFPTGRTEERGRGRAVIWLGSNNPSGSYTKSLDFFDIQSLGTTTKFGEISDTVGLGAGMSSSTRGVFAGGTKPAAGNQNLLEYITIATTGNSKDFGSIGTTFRYGGGISNSTRGLICGAYQGGGASGTKNVIQYITIASLGNTADFGDIIANSNNGIFGAGTCSSSTRGITFGGGTGPSQVNEINHITIGTLGNSVDFGDLSAAKLYMQGVSSSTRGVVAGGYQESGFTSTNVIEFITIASTGDATDFGDLITAARLPGSSGGSNKIRGVFVGGGVHPSYYNTMEFVTIATTGNSSDFGDISTSGGTPYGSVAVSDSHGGL